MYMNCAVVTITGRATGVLDGPGVFVANVGNGCATGEGADVVFPDPGSDIVYGGNAGKRAPPTGNCGAGKTVIAGGGAAGSGAGGGPTTGGGETFGKPDASDTSGPGSSPGAAGAGGDTSGPSSSLGAAGAGGDTSSPGSGPGAAGAGGDTSGPGSSPGAASAGGDTSSPSSGPGAAGVGGNTSGSSSSPGAGAGAGGYTKPVLDTGGEYTSTAAVLPMSTGMTPGD